VGGRSGLARGNIRKRVGALFVSYAPEKKNLLWEKQKLRENQRLLFLNLEMLKENWP